MTPVQKQREVWKHNTYLGHIARAKTAMVNIMESTTATPQTKDIAKTALRYLEMLYNALKKRNEL